MSKRRRLSFRLLPIVGALLLSSALVGCTRDAETEGLVSMSGSSTLRPMMSRVSSGFGALHPFVQFQLESPGTADGFSLFCDGLVQINDASRPIQDREKKACEESGVHYAELAVANDAIVVFTPRQNVAVNCLTTQQLYALLGPESFHFDDWSDANALADELGRPSGPLSKAPLTIVGPGRESGTRAAFIDLAISPFASQRDKLAELRTDYSMQGRDELILGMTVQHPTGLGFVGFPAIVGWEGQIKPLAIDEGKGCVEPTVATIEDGSYPLTRTLYVYVNLEAARHRPAVTAFIDYLLSSAGLSQASAAGSVPLLESEAKRVRETWHEARAK